MPPEFAVVITAHKACAIIFRCGATFGNLPVSKSEIHNNSTHPYRLDMILLLNHQTYRPDASTALLDAIGDTITQISIQTQSSRLPTTVVVVILTDGHENASRLFNLVKIRNMISSLEESGKWTFSFIGVTLDAVDVAESMSIKKQNSFSFEKGEMNNSVWSKLDKSMNYYFEKKKTNRNLDNLFEE